VRGARRRSRGLSVAQVARARGSTERTIEKHIENVLFKTGDRSIVRAANRLLFEALAMSSLDSSSIATCSSVAPRSTPRLRTITAQS